MNRLIYINIILLVVFFVGFGIWYAFKPDGPDPSEPFVQLKAYAEKHGPAKAVDFLGKSQFQSVIQACRRTECIQDKYNGNRGAWITQTTATKKDPCASYRHERCTPTAIRKELEKIMGHLSSCTVVAQLRRQSAVRLRVQCAGVDDFVTVVPAGNGWKISIPDDVDYPGLLPKVHRAIAARPR